MAAGAKSFQIDQFIDGKYIPLEKRIKIAILVAIILLPALLFYFLFFGPKNEEISNLEKQNATADMELKAARKAARDLPQFKKQLEDTQKEFDATAVLLPKSQEIPNLLRNISDLGKTAGLDFLSFTPGAETPKDFYAEIPIDISIKGPYHNLGFFLDKVSKLERIVTVNNIKIDSPKEEGQEMLLNSTCRLMTYRFTNVKLEPQDNKKK